MGETSWIERQWNYFLYLVRRQLLLWRYPVRIVVQWPVDPSSADPNFFYRPTLEQLVGVQGRDWNWDVLAHENKMEIMFKRQHKKTAIFLALKWS